MDPTNLRYALNFRNWNFSKSYISQPSHKEAKNQFLTKTAIKRLWIQLTHKYGKHTLHLPSKVTAIQKNDICQIQIANLVEKKREEFEKARKRTRTSSKCPFSHLLSTNKISYLQKSRVNYWKKNKREGELMIFVTLGVFSKIQKSLRAKKNISQTYVKYENWENHLPNLP